MPHPEQPGRRNTKLSVASIVFVALMFVMISVANVLMQNDWSMRQASGLHSEQTGVAEKTGKR
jgi:hypothetical protein